MALAHARPTELVDIRPLGEAFAAHRTTTLIKTDFLEVIRLVLPAGKEIADHEVPGEITVQCLEGKVRFRVSETERELFPGSLLHLEGSQSHDLKAIEDSTLLVTILLGRKWRILH